MRNNLPEVLQHHLDFWNMENKEPILLLKGSKGKASKLTPPATKAECWLNTEYVVAKEREALENTAFFGDALPLVNPNLGPDIFGATFGTDLIFEETTSYSVPLVDDDWSQELRFDESNKWWQKMLEITDACVEDSQGEYLVGVTDLHPGADGLVSIRGPQELCYDVFDQPEVFEKCQTVLLPAFRKQFESLYNRTQKYQKGTSNWMGLYKDEPWYVTSADFICMLSAEDFDALVLPEIKAELDYLKGCSMFHLDGPQALRHLDRLLELPDLHGIQWVYGAGQPSAKYWLSVLKKIQAAGKAVEVILQPEDIDVIFKELDPRGLLCHFDWDMTEDEARDVYGRIMKFYR